MVEAIVSRELSGVSASIAYRRGVVFATFLHGIESSNFALTKEKSDELMGVVSSIALKPPELRMSTQRYNDIFSAAAKRTIQEFRESPSLEETENRASFYKRMELMPQTDQLRIRIAYDIAKYSHRGIVREGGERYFEHVRGTALILFDECGVRDPDMIIAALLHDSVEDATIFGSQKGITAEEWIAEAGLRLNFLFGPYVSEMVTAVTKPKIDGVDIKDRTDVKRVYLAQLRNASPEAILIKMADRLHNLRTLHFRPLEDQQKVAKETLEDYLPIFERGSLKYAYIGDKLLPEIKDLATQYLSDSPVIYGKDGIIDRKTRQILAYPAVEE